MPAVQSNAKPSYVNTKPKGAVTTWRPKDLLVTSITYNQVPIQTQQLKVYEGHVKGRIIEMSEVIKI